MATHLTITDPIERELHFEENSIQVASPTCNQDSIELDEPLKVERVNSQLSADKKKEI